MKDLVTLTEEILNGKLHFLCSDRNVYHWSVIIDLCDKSNSGVVEVTYCVRSIQIRSNFWSVFSRIRTEYGEIHSAIFLI